MISNTYRRSSIRSADNASIHFKSQLDVNLVKRMFSWIHAAAFLLFSTNTAFFAPRLTASRPMPPLPANRSRNTAPGTSICKILNKVSLIRSVVGRVSLPSIVFKGILRAVPAIILIVGLLMIINEKLCPASDQSCSFKTALFLYR